MLVPVRVTRTLSSAAVSGLSPPPITIAFVPPLAVEAAIQVRPSSLMFAKTIWPLIVLAALFDRMTYPLVDVLMAEPPAPSTPTLVDT